MSSYSLNPTRLLRQLNPASLNLLFDFGSLYTRVALVETQPAKTSKNKQADSSQPTNSSLTNSYHKIQQTCKLLLNQPTCLLLDCESQAPLAIGRQAFKLWGKEPASAQIIFPIKQGAIFDQDQFELYLAALLDQLKHQLSWGWLTKVKASCYVPSSACSLDKEIFRSCFASQGLTQLRISNKAEAVLVNLLNLSATSTTQTTQVTNFLPSSDKGIMAVVDLGDQLTEVIIGAPGRVSFEQTIEFGSNSLTNAIRLHLLKRHQLHVSQVQAMKLKHQLPNLGYLADLDETRLKAKTLNTQMIHVRGVDTVDNLVVTRSIQVQALLEAVINTLPTLAHRLKKVFSQVKIEQLEAALQNGLVLIGGGSQLAGLDRYLAKKLKLNVLLADNPTNFLTNNPIADLSFH